MKLYFAAVSFVATGASIVHQTHAADHLRQGNNLRERRELEHAAPFEALAEAKGTTERNMVGKSGAGSTAESEAIVARESEIMEELTACTSDKVSIQYDLVSCRQDLNTCSDATQTPSGKNTEEQNSPLQLAKLLEDTRKDIAALQNAPSVKDCTLELQTWDNKVKLIQELNTCKHELGRLLSNFFLAKYEFGAEVWGFSDEELNKKLDDCNRTTKLIEYLEWHCGSLVDNDRTHCEFNYLFKSAIVVPKVEPGTVQKCAQEKCSRSMSGSGCFSSDSNLLSSYADWKTGPEECSNDPSCLKEIVSCAGLKGTATEIGIEFMNS